MQQVLANPFHRMWSDCGKDVLGAVAEVGRSGWYVLGEQVRDFERELAQFQGRAAAIGCASGLDAIEIALRALGLKPGQRVLTTPLTAFATSLAVIRAGGVPVFCDVDETGLLDLDQAEELLSENPDIDFLLTVNLFGQALDADRLSDLRSRFSISLVEDCAQSLGARSGSGMAGNAGHAMTLSFYPTKNLGALGDGGAVLVDDPQLETACRRLRDYGQSEKYIHSELGLNSRLDEVHAAILRRAFLPRLEDWTSRRRLIARRYLQALEDSETLRPLPAPSRSNSAWHLFPVLAASGRRDALSQELRDAGVQAGIHYPRIVPDQPALEGASGNCLREPERARELAGREISLPINPYLEDQEIERVLEVIAGLGA